MRRCAKLAFFVGAGWVMLLVCAHCVVADYSVPSIGYDVPALRVLNCIVDNATTHDDCNVRVYSYSLLAAAVPAGLVALLICICAPLYCCGKYVLNCCGGRRQSSNFCCPSADLPAKYNKADLMRPLALAVLCTLLCGATLTWLCVSNTQLQDGAAAMDTSGTRVCDALVNTTAALTTALRHVSYYDGTQRKTVVVTLLPAEDEVRSGKGSGTGSADAAAAAAAAANTPGGRYVLAHRDAVATLQRMRESTTTQLRAEATRFSVAVYILAACTFAASVTLTFLAFCNCRHYLPMLLLCVFCVLALLVWLCNGMYSLTHMLVTDACREVDDAAAGRAHALEPVTACNNTVLRAYAHATDDVLDAFAREACRVLLPFCLDPRLTPTQNVDAGRVLTCPFVTGDGDVAGTGGEAADVCARLPRRTRGAHEWLPPSSLVRVSDDVLADLALQTRLRTMGYLCADTGDEGAGGVVCDVARCAHTCVTPDKANSTLQAGMSEVLTRAEALHRLATMSSMDASFLTSCNGVFAYVVPSLVAPCHAITTAAYDVRQGTGMLGLVTLASLFVCVWGAKRFIAMEQALVPQYDV